MVVGAAPRSGLPGLASDPVTARPEPATVPSRISAPGACPVCGGAMRKAIANVRDPQTTEAFDLIRCSRCELGVTVPAPGDLARYYGERYYGGRHAMTQRYCLRRRMRLLEQMARGTVRGKLVDVGCGDGSFLLEARRSGWTVLGTEVSDRIPSADLEIRGSIDDLRTGAPFDCITLWHSLEHLRSPAEALTELAGMLRPGGALLLAVPDSRGWQARLFGRHWLHLDVPRHLYHFSLPSLRAAFDRAGLDIVRVRHQELEYDLFGWIQSALNWIMPRPNILFDALTRRPGRVSPAVVAANLVLAGLLLVPAFGATVLSAGVGRGGTLVVAGRRRS
jgi:SAM-dependent methyltransferase